MVAEDRRYSHMDVAAQKVETPKPLFSIRFPIDPPYSKIILPPLNDLGLPQKELYTTADVCQVLGISPDNFRHRMLAGHYPEPGRIRDKRRFTEEQVREIMRIDEHRRNVALVTSERKDI